MICNSLISYFPFYITLDSYIHTPDSNNRFEPIIAPYDVITLNYFIVTGCRIPILKNFLKKKKYNYAESLISPFYWTPNELTIIKEFTTVVDAHYFIEVDKVMYLNGIVSRLIDRWTPEFSVDGHTIVAKPCIIPKGTRFFMGEDSLVASEQMIMLDDISYLNRYTDDNGMFISNLLRD